jgi:hypothetical protein
MPKESELLVTRKRKITCLSALCGLLFIFFNSASAQTSQPFPQPNVRAEVNTGSAKIDKTPSVDSGTSSLEIETLKRRLDDVENQNRLLLQMVTELKSRLDASSQPEPKRTNLPAVAATQLSSSPTAAVATAVAAPVTSETSQANSNQTVRWSDLIGEGNKLKFYGFLRLDLDFDSQRPNNAQTPLFITSPDVNAGGVERGNFSMHPRLTRFGVDYTGSQ